MPQLFFKRDFQQAIREGRKQSTIRRWDRPLLSAGQQAYSPGLGWLAIDSVETFRGKILDVFYHLLAVGSGHVEQKVPTGFDDARELARPS